MNKFIVLIFSILFFSNYLRAVESMGDEGVCLEYHKIDKCRAVAEEFKKNLADDIRYFLDHRGKYIDNKNLRVDRDEHAVKSLKYYYEACLIRKDDDEIHEFKRLVSCREVFTFATSYQFYGINLPCVTYERIGSCKSVARMAWLELCVNNKISKESESVCKNFSINDNDKNLKFELLVKTENGFVPYVFNQGFIKTANGDVFPF